MKINEVRRIFLDYFASKGHKIVPSAPLLNPNDPTLMFINAGMNPFKDIFTGQKKAEEKRVADTQKCLRVSGKHNDLEEVGHDTYHLTFFEMLGNWSFGDYFKKEAIEFAWELLTKIYKLPEDRLYITYYNGEGVPEVSEDKETLDIWKNIVPEEKILGFSSKDNFWEMGNTGPCGPCTEIHIDLRPDNERKKIPAQKIINTGNPLVIELWNLVFIQYERKADGSFAELEMKSVDTGMGLERLAMVLQNKTSLYDIDVFQTLKNALFKNENIKELTTNMQEIAVRVILDHVRAVTFAVADGAMPSNTGAGYVIRRILRRALRYGFQFLELKEPFLYKLVPTLGEFYQNIFPEVKKQEKTLQEIIKNEEQSFLKTLGKGIRLFNEFLEKNSEIQTIPGDFAFKLYDTFGFPIDLTRLLAKEKGLNVDEEGFQKFLQKQKEQSRKATATAESDWVILNEGVSYFTGYDNTVSYTRILRYRKVQRKGRTFYQLVLEKTPFYPEGGGQVGDIGTLSKDGEIIYIFDTKKENDLILHFAKKLPEDLRGEWEAKVDELHRRETAAHHSATHLLHAALRKILGNHVQQKGSFVGPEYLRFDFSHPKKLTSEELEKIEATVNQKIAEALPRKEYRNIPMKEAQSMGALAFFGEKYGERVRVIRFGEDFSIELCGGIHVDNTIKIRLFKIVSERAIAGGIRRIEARAASSALDFLLRNHKTLQEVARKLQADKNIVKKLEQILAENKALSKKLEALEREKVQALKKAILSEIQNTPGKSYAKVLKGTNKNALHTLAFELRKQTKGKIILLVSENEGKVLMYLVFSEDITPDKDLNASTLLRELAKIVKGGGGGQPFLASAGGKDSSKIPELIKTFHKKIQE